MFNRLWMIIFILTSFQSVASFIGPDGKPYSETEYRKTDGHFGAELVITHKEEEALKNWSIESKGVYFPTTDTFYKGKIITALVVFKGCQKIDNKCQLSQKHRIIQPDGKVYADIPESELWFNRQSPLDGSIGLGVDYVRLIVEPHEQLGNYTFEVSVKDYQTNKILKLSKTIMVVE